MVLYLTIFASLIYLAFVLMKKIKLGKSISSLVVGKVFKRTPGIDNYIIAYVVIVMFLVATIIASYKSYLLLGEDEITGMIFVASLSYGCLIFSIVRLLTMKSNLTIREYGITFVTTCISSKEIISVSFDSEQLMVATHCKVYRFAFKFNDLELCKNAILSILPHGIVSEK